ncbi:MAG: phosphoenolpyruvate carboxylase [Mesobacillus sp.]|uniref:phosphoenolpyruvate carboxylase n=1 Tax=Mesobacillus sp. TaxID=2675271 RepID=UPI003C3EF0DE
MTSGIEVNDSSLPLRRDVKMLGNILGDILVYHGGVELFEKVEKIRAMCKALRNDNDSETYTELKDEIAKLSVPMRTNIIRAFSVYFHLINAAEQNHRIRRRRDYLMKSEISAQPGSIEAAILSLKDNHITSDIIQDVLNTISLELIITAHPTEATKRSILEIQKRIADILKSLDNPILSKREREKVEESLFNEVSVLWQTDELRDRKPTVIDEVRNGLYYFDQTLFDVLPEIHQEVATSLKAHYAEHEWDVPHFLRFGSWIGGDRDGNPNVTPEVTWETLQRQRRLVLKKYKAVLVDLMKRFSQSTTRAAVSDELKQSVMQDEEKYLTEDQKWTIEGEVYRRKFAIILERLRQAGKSELGYHSSEEMLEDLMIIKRSIYLHHPAHHELKTLQKLISQVQLFGFHLATLDIRNHSGEHETAIAEIFRKVGITKDYPSLSEDAKLDLLKKILADPRPLLLLHDDYSIETQEMLNTFKMIKRAHNEFGKRSITVYLVSMTQSASDLLEVLVLAKEAGI